jgi:hypothetical protein
VSVLNSTDIDFALTSSYDKIRNYQQQKEHEAITALLSAKLTHLRKLLPVRQEHIIYTES